MSWYSIRAAADTRHADVMLYDPIGKSWWEETTDAKSFVKQLEALDVDTITVRINSPGGDVFDGVAIFNALRQHQAKVTTRIEGLAASIASVIALAGDTVTICSNAMLMIHNSHTYAQGNASELMKVVQMLEQVDETIITTYASRTGLEREHLAAEMAREAWYTADDALELGFVDGIDETASDDAVAAIAAFDRRITARFANPPERVAALLQATPKAAGRERADACELDVARARREREAASY